ncbi:Pin4 protein [Starmerella bacillaris]|uniref:Pin4 protein n=1 Tax=Starmerella bacillaris TaxID=1247836 RepID=A0AAV5RJH2_STABA|nr:Pin4 protein [Starmerella bacillaris]
MSTAKLAFMTSNNKKNASPSPSVNKIWSPAQPATPQPSLNSVWSSPNLTSMTTAAKITSTGSKYSNKHSLSSISLHDNSPSAFPRPTDTPHSLAELAADSEPIIPMHPTHGALFGSATSPLSAASSRLGSREGSTADVSSVHLPRSEANSVCGSPEPHISSLMKMHSSVRSHSHSRNNSGSFPGSLLPSNNAGLGLGNSTNMDKLEGSNTVPTSPVSAQEPHGQVSNASNNNQSNQGSQSTQSAQSNSSNPDEIINTAIVVKNIPFAIKKEQLIDFMTQQGLPLPYAFNYHFDNGVFRGLAFANFANADETAMVISVLNGCDLMGRKLRVEYKKMLPFQERERIEREKRERRGQLEEQHKQTPKRSTSVPPSHVASPSPSNSQISSGTPHSASAAGSSSANNSGNSNAASNGIVPTSNLANHVGHNPHAYLPASSLVQNSASLLTSSSGSTLTSVGSQTAPPSRAASPKLSNRILVDMNDRNNLDTYTSLVVFKHDKTKSELVFSPEVVAGFQPQQVNVLSSLCKQLNLVLSMDHGIIISKNRPHNLSLNLGIMSEDHEDKERMLGLCQYASLVVTTPPINNLSLTNPVMNPLSRWNSSTNLHSMSSSSLNSSFFPSQHAGAAPNSANPMSPMNPGNSVNTGGFGHSGKPMVPHPASQWSVKGQSSSLNGDRGSIYDTRF